MDSNYHSVNRLWDDWFKHDPYNFYLFFLGIFLWFAVGVLWKDKAIMVVHVGAFISLLVGYLNA